MTPQPDFKGALDALAEYETYPGAGSAVQFLSDNMLEVRCALLIADALMQEPTSMMEIEGARAHDEVNRGCFYQQEFDAEKVFKAMRDQLLREVNHAQSQ